MFVKTVVRGDGDGSVLGYPTANFEIQSEELNLDTGIYAATVKHDEKEYKGALCVHEDAKKVEVHLIDYVGGPLYGERLEVIPLDKVSEFEAHSMLSDLKQKIASDVDRVKAYFES